MVVNDFEQFYAIDEVDWGKTILKDEKSNYQYKEESLPNHGCYLFARVDGC